MPNEGVVPLLGADWELIVEGGPKLAVSSHDEHGSHEPWPGLGDCAHTHVPRSWEVSGHRATPARYIRSGTMFKRERGSSDRSLGGFSAAHVVITDPGL